MPINDDNIDALGTNSYLIVLSKLPLGISRGPGELESGCSGKS